MPYFPAVMPYFPALTDTTDLIWHFSTPDLQKWKAGVIKDGATRFDPE